jgi:hypothetical protein
MDGYTESLIVKALGALAMAKAGAEDLGGLSETQESEINEAMRHIGNVMLEEETIRKGGRAA